MPSPPNVAYKTLPAALALSVSSSLPVYLVPIVLPIVSQYAFVASSKTELYSRFVSLSSCSSISLLPTHFIAPELLSVPPAMPKKKSPEDFFQRAREKGSGINKAIVNGAEVQKHLQPKTAKSYARALDLWNGYAQDHPGADPYDLETLKDNVRDVAYRIDGAYGDPKAGGKASYNTGKTSRPDGGGTTPPYLPQRHSPSQMLFIKEPLRTELGLANRKRIRSYDKLYSTAQRMKHGGHKDERTFGDSYMPNNAGTDLQGGYFDGKLRSIVNDRFRGMTLHRNPVLWQALPANKQYELENTPEFTAIEEEIKALAPMDPISHLRR